MNCRFTAIDARHCSVTRSFVVFGGIAGMSLCNEIGAALHHGPGEGCRDSS
jgi:hypothetical protein